MKDLSKAFLTLLTAVLVVSVTFSEKIVNFQYRRLGPKLALVVCWILLLVAIASVGSALALMTYALGFAVYFPDTEYSVLENRAVILFIVSGLSFGAAMTSLLVASLMAAVRLHRKSVELNV